MPADRFSEVLVVEDSQDELAVLCDILEDEGFTVVGCGSAAEALQSIEQRDFGVAVVDLRLPDLSGNQLLDRIRSLDEEIRVIIYTGAASYDSIKEALNLGAFAYVEKLSDPGELLRHVHRACRERVDQYAETLEAAVAKRTEELTHSVRELEDFASVVAHDLRSPLLTISSYCQILRDQCSGQLSGEAGESLGHITNGVGRMNRLIEDLLDYSRVGRSDCPFQPIELDSVLAQARANLDAAIRQDDAEVSCEPMPVVMGNPTQLVQLFQNLIGNAIKFRRDVRPIVRLSVHPQDDCFQFAIQDNGIGIETEQFDRVFQVFQRVHGQRYSGTGIGLAICKRIVERHGGKIWLESKPEHGTTFFFTLPRPEQAA